MAFNFTFSLVCILKCMQHLLNVLFNLDAVNFHQCPHFSHPLWPICLVHSPPPAPVEVRFLVCLQDPSLEGKKRKLNSQEASVLPSPTPAVAPESITQTSHGPLSWAKFFKHFLKKKKNLVCHRLFRNKICGVGKVAAGHLSCDKQKPFLYCHWKKKGTGGVRQAQRWHLKANYHKEGESRPPLSAPSIWCDVLGKTRTCFWIRLMQSDSGIC